MFKGLHETVNSFLNNAAAFCYFKLENISTPPANILTGSVNLCQEHDWIASLRQAWLISLSRLAADKLPCLPQCENLNVLVVVPVLP